MEYDVRQQFVDRAALRGLRAAAHHVGCTCRDGKADRVGVRHPLFGCIGQRGDHTVARAHSASHRYAQALGAIGSIRADKQRVFFGMGIMGEGCEQITFVIDHQKGHFPLPE